MRFICIIGVFLAAGCVSAEDVEPDFAIQKRLGEQRCPLRTNSPEAIYAEMDDPIVPLRIAKAVSLEIRNAFNIVVGGDDESCNIVLTWPRASKISSVAFLNEISRYVQLRRAGVSVNGSIAIIEKPITLYGSDYDFALSMTSEWLRADMLMKLNEPTVSFPWIEKDHFMFIDSDVRYFVRFYRNTEGHIFAGRYALDPSEFLPANKVRFKNAQKLAQKEFKKTGSAMRYWRRLKATLRQSGIEWMSPNELNPHTHWH